MLDVIQRQSLQEESIHKKMRIRAVANKKALSEIIQGQSKIPERRRRIDHLVMTSDIRLSHVGTMYPQRGPLNTQGPCTHREDH